ncbi:ATP-binding protein [Nonomuraea sp. NPDC050153]|uniref:ATP-binding protein n=1 Tax=Nonomuraea sp. NPDC050153 TaxID=3364359 RepID=UPI00378D7215
MDNRTQYTLSSKPIRDIAARAHQPSRGEEFPDLAPGLVMSTFRSRQLWRGMAWRRAFAGRGDQSAPARRMVGQLLADTGRAEDAQWVTAELVSNALRHTCSGRERGFFVVEVLRGADVARIVVYDLGGGPAPDFSRTPGSPPELAEHGRGLAGVAELAVRIGAAGDAITGHAVWAELAFTSGTARAARNADEVRLRPAAGAVDVAGREPEVASAREFEPASAGLSAPVASATACHDAAVSRHEETAGDVPDSRPGGVPGVLMVPMRRPGSDGGEGAVDLDPSTDLWRPC